MLLVVACSICQVGDIYPIRASDVVILQEFGRGGPLARLLTAPTLDMKLLLVACLGRVETKLRAVPDILGVRFPQYRDSAGEGSEDEELIWAMLYAVLCSMLCYAMLYDVLCGMLCLLCYALCCAMLYAMLCSLICRSASIFADSFNFRLPRGGWSAKKKHLPPHNIS